MLQATSRICRPAELPTGLKVWGIRSATEEGGRSAVQKARVIVLAGAAVAGLSLVAMWLFDEVTGTLPYAPPVEESRSRAEILDACHAHVRAAEGEARAAVDRHAADFASLIEQRKSGAAAFSREMVSWRSKWRVVKQYLPFTDPDGHRKYVEEQFAKHIFSEAELAGTTRLAVTESLKDIEGIENRLAVRLRSEIVGQPINAVQTSTAEQEFATAIRQIQSASQWDAAKTVGNLAVAEAASAVGTQVLVRLGVSAGILGTGAATSGWTIGGSLVLGVLVDAVWQWIDDPAGDIERETVAALEQLAVDGEAALSAELGELVTARRVLWDRAVEEWVP